jgi:cell division protein FtsQ
MTERSAASSGDGRRWRLVRARDDAVPPSVRLFTARARQRRLRAARPWLLALAVIVLVSAGAVVVFATPVLGVARIRVAGAHLVTADEVRAAAGVDPGTPLARVDLAAVSRRVGQLLPVRRATASRSWPDTLVVEVQERTGFAVVAQPAGFGVLDDSGVVFATQPTRPADLALLRLATPGPDDPATRAALAVLASLTDELRSRLVELRAEAPTRVRLALAGGRVVVWGDATENDLKARVATSLLTKPGVLIDVSAPNVPTVR